MLRALPLALILGITAPAALAQSAADAPAGVRVLHDLVDEVKLDDGTTARWRFRTTYDPETGITEHVVTDESGRVVRRESGSGGLNVPSPEEIAQAEAIIRADPEIAALIAKASDPRVSGGFILQREAGHPCGPGSRCLQFDVLNVNHEERRNTRIRFVVVDMREGRMLFRDFDPAGEGNSANPVESRSYAR
jgi:hypothetical protein